VTLTVLQVDITAETVAPVEAARAGDTFRLQLGAVAVTMRVDQALELVADLAEAIAQEGRR